MACGLVVRWKARESLDAGCCFPGGKQHDGAPGAAIRNPHPEPKALQLLRTTRHNTQRKLS